MDRGVVILRSALMMFAFVGSFLFLAPETAFPQGETTSAIVGTVSDQTGAAVPGATVTITHVDTGLKRASTTDDSGRFNFPQLKPGAYSVNVEAEGFQSQQNDGMASALGQKQTVDFTLKIVESK